MHNGNTRRRKNRRNIWINNDGEFPQINVRYQIVDPGSFENTKWHKCQKLDLGISFSNYNHHRHHHNHHHPEGSQRGKKKKKNTLSIENKNKDYIDFSETMQPWSGLKYLKYWGKIHQLRIPYPVNLFFNTEEEILS